MIQLRHYQTESILALRKGFNERNQRQVLCLPTGAGKTVVFSEMVRLAAIRGTRTLVLTDRLELFDQTFKALSRVGINPERIEAGRKHFNANALIHVGMVETVKRRALDGFEPDLIICDEAHKGNFTPILERWPNAKIIGATATPVGKHFHKYYTNIVANIDIPELIDAGYLSKCRAFQMIADLSDLETKAGEYTDETLSIHFIKQTLFDGVIDEWRNKTPNQKTLIFNVNINHANEMNRSFNAVGIRSEVVTSETPKDERAAILSGFKMGAFPVLNNCGILTTGYDEPTIECIVMNRATKSLPLWLQCCGRGSRTTETKDTFTVLDFGMNHDQHGLWSEARTWSLKPPKKKPERAAGVTECDGCGALLPVNMRLCQFCGAIKTAPEKAEPEKGVMVEVSAMAPTHLIGKRVSELTMSELIEVQKSGRYKPTFCWRVVRSMGRQAVTDYANLVGYSRGWIYRQTLPQVMADSNFTDYTIR